MLDSEIVAAIVAGDPDGLAAAYDRYAGPLHAFCCSLLNEQADATDAVQDTLIIAGAKLDGLQDPDLLKSWLFAVARNECHRQLRARSGDAAGEVSDHTVDLGVDLERAELPEVVGAAVAALPTDKREVIELSLGQDFDGDDLASTLGISVNQAHGLASRARGQFEKSVGALLVARSGRLYCDTLDELLDGQGGRLTAAMCRDLSRHVQHCRVCSGRMRRDLQPALLLGVLPATEILRGQRQQVLNVVASDAPDVVAYRAEVVRGAAPFAASGFPVAVDRPRRERRLGPAGLALGATVLLAALCAVVLEFGLHHPHRVPHLAAAPLGGQPVSSSQAQTASPSQPGRPHTSSPARPGSLTAATPGVTPTVSVPVPPPATQPLGSRSPSTPPSTPPTTPPTTPPSQAPGTLSASPASVALGVSPGGGAASGSFTITANGAAVNYSISVPAAYAGALAVSPSGGSLGAGASVTISVTWNSSVALSTSLGVNPGGQAVSVSYQLPGG